MEKLQQQSYYMLATLTFERAPDQFVMDGKQLKAIILHALQSLHGQVGAAVKVDVLKCSYEHGSSVCLLVLRVLFNELVKVWSALTLLGCYGNIPCVFTVSKVSASLVSLAVDSRSFQFVSNPSLQESHIV